MQQRHLDRRQYFEELSRTSEKYIIPFIEKYFSLKEDMAVLEVGCGEGGNLKPLVSGGRITNRVVGVDISEIRINQAKEFFKKEISENRIELLASDIFEVKGLEHAFDLILIHDVIEHISDKDGFLAFLHLLLKKGGVIFIAFPAWQMPFGGHQQICKSRFASHAPFIHLLPANLYAFVLRCCRESRAVINELLDIKACGLSVEQFRKKMSYLGYAILKEELYFINPHYETKFGLQCRVLSPLLACIPYLRNFFTTSCFYLIKERKG